MEPYITRAQCQSVAGNKNQLEKSAKNCSELTCMVGALMGIGGSLANVLDCKNPVARCLTTLSIRVKDLFSSSSESTLVQMH